MPHSEIDATHETALTNSGFAAIRELHAERVAFESWSQFVLEALTSE